MGIEIGQVIDGKYRVTACIGEGGMGAVYAGEHLRLHRRVAVKVLHAAMAREAETVGRFEREAQAAGRIGNDHILEVLDIGELPGGDRYIVMEFLDGEPFDKRLARFGRMMPRQLYPLARQLLEGLGAAHAAGIVHRDLKPANVFILREKAGIADYVKLIDFGISKFQSTADNNKTRTGTIIGTPSYMSPEQARGLREADARSDIYAVGVILYEAVTGRVPFEGTSTNDVLFKIFLNDAPPIESVVSDVDPAFCTLVMKALAKEPGDRFQTAAEFIAALDAWANVGAAVVVPKPVAMAETLLELRSPTSPAARTPAPAARTPGAWSSSGVELPSGVPRSPARAIGIALALVALGAGGAVWALLGRHPKPGHEDVTATVATPPPPPVPLPAAVPPSSAPPSLPSLPSAPPPAADVSAPVPPVDSARAALPAPPRGRRDEPRPAPSSTPHAHARPAPAASAPPAGSDVPNFGY